MTEGSEVVTETLDVWRTLLLAAGGISFGLALAECRVYLIRYRAAARGEPLGPLAPRRLLGMFLVRLGVAAGSLFVITSIASIYGRDEVTWRAPAATVVLTLLIVGMVMILSDDQRLVMERGEDPPRRRGDDHDRS